jgi:hypothetical protein
MTDRYSISDSEKGKPVHMFSCCTTYRTENVMAKLEESVDLPLFKYNIYYL